MPVASSNCAINEKQRPKGNGKLYKPYGYEVKEAEARGFPLLLLGLLLTVVIALLPGPGIGIGIGLFRPLVLRSHKPLSMAKPSRRA